MFKSWWKDAREMNDINTEKLKIIYDLGANNGDDIPYYLKKADLVIAVEANPKLTQEMRVKYKNEITSGRLCIENCVITTNESDKLVPFYLYKKDHIVSQFLKPCDSQIINFEEVMLPSISIVDLVKKYGDPFYIKIDLEGYDQEILRSLFENKIFPEWISAESHNIEIFSLLVSSNFYKSFNLIDGGTVEKKYKSAKIQTNSGQELFTFLPHSAGPFGEDLRTEWLTATDLFFLLAYEGLGWKDIHATNKILAKPQSNSFPYFAKKFLLKKITPKFLRSIIIK
jgi:FkbM family methyltransferase